MPLVSGAVVDVPEVLSDGTRVDDEDDDVSSSSSWLLLVVPGDEVELLELLPEPEDG